MNAISGPSVRSLEGVSEFFPRTDEVGAALLGPERRLPGGRIAGFQPAAVSRARAGKMPAVRPAGSRRSERVHGDFITTSTALCAVEWLGMTPRFFLSGTARCRTSARDAFGDGELKVREKCGLRQHLCFTSSQISTVFHD